MKPTKKQNVLVAKKTSRKKQGEERTNPICPFCALVIRLKISSKDRRNKECNSQKKDEESSR